MQGKGYFYATAMLCGLLVGTLCDNQHFQRVVRAGFRLRGVLTHEVFRKARLVFSTLNLARSFVPLCAQAPACAACSPARSSGR